MLQAKSIKNPTVVISILWMVLFKNDPSSKLSLFSWATYVFFKESRLPKTNLIFHNHTTSGLKSFNPQIDFLAIFKFFAARFCWFSNLAKPSDYSEIIFRRHFQLLLCQKVYLINICLRAYRHFLFYFVYFPWVYAEKRWQCNLIHNICENISDFYMKRMAPFVCPVTAIYCRNISTLL